MISTGTVSLVEGLLRSLVESGAIQRAEADAVVSRLQADVSDREKGEGSGRKLLTRAEAGQRLGVSTKTISRMLEAGELDRRYLRKGSPRTLRITSKSIEQIETGRFN